MGAHPFTTDNHPSTYNGCPPLHPSMMDAHSSIQPSMKDVRDECKCHVHTVAPKDLGHHMVSLSRGARSQCDHGQAAACAWATAAGLLLSSVCTGTLCWRCERSVLSALLLQSGGMFFCKTATGIFKQASHSYRGQLM